MISTSKSKNYQIDMCSGAILPKLLLFALPLIGSSILQLLFNAADVQTQIHPCSDIEVRNQMALAVSSRNFLSLGTRLGNGSCWSV